LSLECGNHRGVVRILLYLQFVLFVLATKCLVGYVVFIKLFHFFVIEAKPRVIGIFFRAMLSVLDVTIVMTCISSALMNHNTLELEFVVALCDLPIKYYLFRF
jgi:hypothetical protein